MSGQKLALIGAGGFAKEVAEVAELNGFEVTGCYSQTPGNFSALHKGYLDELLRDRAQYQGAILGVGGVDRRSIARRRTLVDWLSKANIACPSIVSPSAVRSKGVDVGAGAFVAHGVILGVDAVLKSFCVVNSGAIIGHDAVIGVNAICAPGAFLGGVSEVGEDALIGPLSKVLQGAKIGRDVVLGVGCVALRSLPDGSTVWPRPDRTT